MKIKVHFALCASNALSDALAPTPFHADDHDFLQILDENVTPEDLDAVKQAVAACPKSAITLVDD